MTVTERIVELEQDLQEIRHKYARALEFEYRRAKGLTVEEFVDGVDGFVDIVVSAVMHLYLEVHGLLAKAECDALKKNEEGTK